jgi:hypothetical protein
MITGDFILADLDKFWWETVIRYCTSYEVAKHSGCIGCVQNQIWKVLQKNLKSCQQTQNQNLKSCQQTQDQNLKSCQQTQF